MQRAVGGVARMRIALLLLHAISATLLLGAVTHQALASWWPERPGSGWWRALRAVHPERYVRATIVLYLSTAMLGAVLYPPFVAVARFRFLDAHAPWATGLFQIKEHAAAVGVALLPAYGAVWRTPAGAAEPARAAARRAITTLLFVIVWWNFVIGHVVNNTRGL